MNTLVFLHGRGQEFKDPAQLKLKWLAGLNAGLTRAALPPLSPDGIVFPFYANVLYQITARLAQDRTRVDLEKISDKPDEPGPLHPYVPEDVGEREREIIADMAGLTGIEPTEPEGFRFDRLLSWRATRRLLVQISRLTRADQEIITEHIRDVAVYLTHGRDAVLDAVRADIPPDVDLVLITHSLGTVVARDLLDDDDIRHRTRLWVTAGSPLGIEAVQHNLRTPGAKHPDDVDWVTTYDVNDVIALGHPLRDIYGPPLRDIKVDNGDKPHAIDRYLDHPELPKLIKQAHDSN
jgi:hypothetical protein